MDVLTERSQRVSANHFSLMFFSLPPDHPKVVFSPLSYLCCTLMSAKVLWTGVALLNLQMTQSLCLFSVMWIQKSPSAIASVFICPSGRYTSVNIFVALLVTSWPESDVLTSVCKCQWHFYEDVFLFVVFSPIFSNLHLLVLGHCTPLNLETSTLP